MAYISIIIPCYNVENLIDRCMESICNQTIGIENLEVILVNDASTDGTYNKLLEWEAKYPESIMVISYDTNIRQGGARNVGLSYASSELIGFVDSDDWVEPDMYEILYKGMRESNCDTVRCKYIRDEGNAKIINTDGTETIRLGEEQNGLYWWDENSNPDESDGGVWGGVYSRIYKKALIFDNEVFFPENIAYEDNYWLSVLLLYCKSELRINRILYHYYVNTDSTIMKRDSQHHMDRLEIETGLLEEYKKRGAFDLFHDSIMVDFIQRFYLNTYHIVFTKFSVYPEIYRQIRETVYAYFPNWVQTFNAMNDGLVNSIPMLRTLSEKENISSEELSHIYWGKKEIRYPEILFFDKDRIVDIEVETADIKKYGSLNPELGECGDFDLACRICEDEGVIYVCEKETSAYETPVASNIQESRELIGKTYAYILKRNMQRLYSENQMENVFGRICALMTEKNCNDAFMSYLNRFLTDSYQYERLFSYTAPYIVIKGDDTCGGVMRNFADKIEAGLNEIGQAVLKIESEESIDNILDGGIYKGIIGFQTTALENSFIRRIKAAKLQFWFDDPMFFGNLLNRLPDDYYVLSQDEGYASFIKKYHHTQKALHFPPGGDVYACEEDIPRNTDVCFIGTFFPDNTDALNDRQLEFYKYMKDNPCISFEQGIIEHFGISEDDIFQYMSEMRPACRAVIGFFRAKVISELLAGGIDVDVYGEEWNDFTIPKGENAGKLTIHSRIAPADIAKELRRAKIGLNIMSWHKGGMTERISDIMLSGAVCVSDETTYLRNEFTDGEEIVLFRLDRLKCMVGRIKELLGNNTLIETISRKGYEHAVKKFTWTERACELNNLVENRLRSENTLRLFIATHVKFVPPNNPIYEPLHVGKSGKPDLGYIGDNTGDNISDLNFLYGELTGLYWIYRNVYDAEYVGLCHYRRYFVDEMMYPMTEGEYLSILQEYDAIVPKAMECEDADNYFDHYGNAHNIEDLKSVQRAVEKLYPEYVDAFEKAMTGKKYYWGNLVVTRLSVLKAYSEWLFNIFAEAGEYIDVSGYDEYHRRVYGFLSEQMFYVFALANNLSLWEQAVGLSEEKAETKSLKDNLKRFIEEGNTKAARELLEESIKKRPDLLLPGSDVNGELRELSNLLLR